MEITDTMAFKIAWKRGQYWGQAHWQEGPVCQNHRLQRRSQERPTEQQVLLQSHARAGAACEFRAVPAQVPGSGPCPGPRERSLPRSQGALRNRDPPSHSRESSEARAARASARAGQSRRPHFLLPPDTASLRSPQQWGPRSPRAQMDLHVGTDTVPRQAAPWPWEREDCNTRHGTTGQSHGREWSGAYNQGHIQMHSKWTHVET